VVKAVILDTDAFSVLAEKRPGAEKIAVIGSADTLLAFASVAELAYGAHLARWGSARVRRLEAAIARHGLLMPTDGLLRLWGVLRAGAVGMGHPLGHGHHANDLWIAACAVHYEVPLVTGNSRHFAGLPICGWSRSGGSGSGSVDRLTGGPVGRVWRAVGRPGIIGT
jgi:tRNA(fMet)-specific endonuclease VapC